MDCTCYSHNGFMTRAGYALVAQWELELHGVDTMTSLLYIDREGSVSAPVEVEDLYADVTDKMLDEQVRRAHHGS